MAKKKVRTKAQRSAAAKASWALRKLQAAGKPTSTKAHRTPLPGVEFDSPPAFSAPTTAVATREGNDLYVSISSGGSIFRHLLSRDTMRKLGLDCLQLVG